jgi:threonine aldolase
MAAGEQFASDNSSAICPEAWDALAAANRGYAPSYGADCWTERALQGVRALFERPDARVFFLLNGTAANALALATRCRSFDAILCHERAHVHTSECGAPEFFTGGAKLLPLPGADGKLDAAAVAAQIESQAGLRQPRPGAMSLSQATEFGTVYHVGELRALSEVAHQHRMCVQMDGARFANAVAALQVSPAELSWRAGVDVLCLGGTKNGLNTTEALVFFDLALARDFEFRHKQAGQLASKMRFQSSQWAAVLESGAWLRHANHANAMAARLAASLAGLPGVRLLLPVDVNAVFVELLPAVAQSLRDRGWVFHPFIGEHGYRLMCSWSTTSADVEEFTSDLRASLAST